MTSQHQGEPAGQPPRLTGGERLAIAAGSIPAAAGAILSWGGMYEAARTAFDVQWFGALVPVAVDGMIAFGAAGWLASVRAGRRGTAWRAIAHTFVCLTIALNAYAADTLGAVPWHIGGPLAWSLLVEVVAHHVALRRADELGEPVDHIPARLWLTAPGESFRTVLRMARTGEKSAAVARVDADRCEAAIAALRDEADLAANHRRILVRRLRAGSLQPNSVLTAVGWVGDGRVGLVGPDGCPLPRGAAIFRTALGLVLAERSDPTPDPEPVGLVEVANSPAVAPVGVVSDPNPERVGPAVAPVGVVSDPNPERVAPASGGVVGAGAAAPRTQVTATTDTGDAPQARPEDLERARAAIRAGELPPKPSAERIRKHLNIGLANARATRDTLARVNGSSHTHDD